MFSLTLKTIIFVKHLKSFQLSLHSISNESTKHCLNKKIIKTLNVKNALMSEPSDQLISISGWIKSTRKQKPVFLHINDGSVAKHLQVVVNEEVVKTIDKELYNGCSVECVGRLVSSPGPKQSVELLCETMEVLGECNPNEFPFTQRNTSYKTHYFRQYYHLRPRYELFSSMARIRSEAMNSIHVFMRQNDFINITTPVITSNNCEGGCHVFSVQSPFCTEDKKYFDRETFLTVSSQLHLEAMASALSRVYTLNPCFRAEKSLSRKHLSEFLMFEVEEAFVSSVEQLMDRVESICKFIAYYIRHNCSHDLNLVLKQTNYKHLDTILNSKYIRMTYNEAIDLLKRSNKFTNLKFGQNLNAEQELFLVDSMDSIPVFITHFPSHLKPFYMKRIDGQALCFDLLSPICGEVCGGSVREDCVTELENRIKEMNLNVESLEWYLDLRRYGNVIHSGFGFGFDRLIQTFTGLKNIKDVSTFPRFLHNCPL